MANRGKARSLALALGLASKRRSNEKLPPGVTSKLTNSFQAGRVQRWSRGTAGGWRMTADTAMLRSVLRKIFSTPGRLPQNVQRRNVTVRRKLWKFGLPNIASPSGALGAEVLAELSGSACCGTERNAVRALSVA